MAISANRAQLIWSPVLGWVLLSCLASGAQAQEETSTPALQTLEQDAIGAGVIDLPGPISSSDSRELGITMGAFTLYPSIELLGGYDDNVFATTSPTTGSLFTVVRPQLELRSEWLNHSLRLLATGGFGFYASAPTQNFQNYGLIAEGRYDIRESMYVSGKIGAVRNTEALGTPDVSFAQAPTVVDSFPVEVSFYQRFNRFFYQLTGAAVKYMYYDYSTITATDMPGTSRDMTSYEERIRLGYEITDETSLFVTPGLNQRVYDQFINAAGQQRDSRSWFVNFGATTKLSPKSQLEGFVGYQSLSYIIDGTTTGAYTFGLTGSWNGYEPLVLRPQFLRSINESALSNYQNYVSTTLGVDFTYDVHGRRAPTPPACSRGRESPRCAR
ncbi:MAG: outer membrane beta-barrel protein, partial [Rhodospirillales bacterium]|nr:outer membrane beta-barrel protein [Rhodospirillales bacterium]